jgi:hypothetical protein
MSLILKQLFKKESNLKIHNSTKPSESEMTNENYTSWLRARIQIERDIKKLKDRIHDKDKGKDTDYQIPPIFSVIFLDPIVVNINDETDFEFIQWYENASTMERSDMLKKYIIDGYTKNK